MMNLNSQQSWETLPESTKALANSLFDNDDIESVKENFKSISSLNQENASLKEEVVSLRENLPFKDKYGNLQKEYQKVTLERDSLRASAVQHTKTKSEYEELKGQYQAKCKELDDLKRELIQIKQMDQGTKALEEIYQHFKKDFNAGGLDIRRIPAHLDIQMILDNGSGCWVRKEFQRTSATKWTRVK